MFSDTNSRLGAAMKYAESKSMLGIAFDGTMKVFSAFVAATGGANVDCTRYRETMTTSEQKKITSLVEKYPALHDEQAFKEAMDEWNSRAQVGSPFRPPALFGACAHTRLTHA
jgi:uncharacterized protein (UPF0303 family)